MSQMCNAGLAPPVCNALLPVYYAVGIIVEVMTWQGHVVTYSTVEAAREEEVEK